MMARIAIKAETSMSEPPAPQKNAITRNRMSGVLSVPRKRESRCRKGSWMPAFAGAGEDIDRPFRVEKAYVK
jgi:hypothetical protein